VERVTSHESFITSRISLACCSSARLNARAAAAAETILVRSASAAALRNHIVIVTFIIIIIIMRHNHASPLRLLLVHFNQILEITHKFPTSARHPSSPPPPHTHTFTLSHLFATARFTLAPRAAAAAARSPRTRECARERRQQRAIAWRRVAITAFLRENVKKKQAAECMYTHT